MKTDQSTGGRALCSISVSYQKGMPHSGLQARDYLCYLSNSMKLSP
jgi:hypothetical protein